MPDSLHEKQAPPGRPDLICFSHLRWGFVQQRPQHLMRRFAREGRVFFFEEPFHDAGPTRLEIQRDPSGVHVVQPYIPAGLSEERSIATVRGLVEELYVEFALAEPILWYYTPMMRPQSRALPASLVVYDCMDELSLFKGAPAALREREGELFRAADLVFTGGQSLYEHKRSTMQHPRIYPFPSSVDVPHFAQARGCREAPADQAAIPSPRLGFFGVIDERMDIDLVAGLADARPDWQIVLIGPVVKIDPAMLPRRGNVHYLGSKPYEALPGYLAGWDVALLPFARNDATRFISPTKTPEYLAAGCPVVSTSVRDVVRPYGEQQLARIADTVEAFVAACEAAMHEDRDERLARVDAFLAQMSWDKTWGRMRELIDTAVAARRGRIGRRATDRVAPIRVTRAPASSEPIAADAAGSDHV